MKDTVAIFKRLEDKKIQSKLFALLDKKYTYADLNAGLAKVTGFFQEKGLAVGDRLIISSRDNYAVSLLFLSCLRNGITAMMLDPDMGTVRASELIALTEPKGLLVDHELVEEWNLEGKTDFILPIKKERQKKGLLFKKMLKSKNNGQQKATTFPAILNQLETADGPAQLDPENIAYILFTSGSTSTPKAVQISHRALWANLNTITKVYNLEREDRVFNILTAYHTDGIIQGPVLAVLNTLSWYHPFEFAIDKIEAIFDSIYKYRITHFITVPTMLAFLNKFSDGFEDTFDNEDFKSIVTSASPFESELWSSFEQKFNTRVVNNYGLTETVAGASYCGPSAATHRLGSVGVPVDCEFKIINEAGEAVGDNESGELLIKGENLLTNYFNNEEATAAALKDGWFHTGDYAKRDEDGFYYIVGRKKNLIISGGINIQPEEVTAVLNAHPAIMESASLGIPDDIFGEKLVAAVVLNAGASVDELDLVEHCRKELEEAKVPKDIHFVAGIPKTGSGKIKYREVEEMLKTTRELVMSNGDQAYAQGILAAAADAFKVDASKLDMKGDSMTIDGWDSMAHLVFITNLEDQFKVRFNSKEIMVMNTLAEAEQILAAKLN
ncbi:MAG: AMP-binding protein [Saprospiraceae bacterium]|nr:AMP-binding protein [Saprospiraceae bacterium]